MKLLHLANFGSTNVGNGALIDGTERVIREDFPEPVEFVHEPWDDYFIEGIPGPKKFDQTFVDKVNARDALIVGGAVMFREDHVRFQMPFGMHKPVIFYGVSYRVWSGVPYYVGGHFSMDMARTLSYPKTIVGVRNDGTEKWLRSKLEFDSEKIVTIPDPGLYVESKCILPLEPEKDRTNIVVALNYEDDEDRFGGRMEWLDNLAKALRMFWEQSPNVNFIFSPHTYEDYILLYKLCGRLPDKMCYQNIISTGIHYAYQAPLFYDLYTHVDLILAMRIHAMVPAIGLGTPMLALSTQKRMDVFMKDAKLGYYLMNLFDVTPGQLYGKMEACLKYPSNVKTDFYKVRDEMRKKTKVFNERIYNFIKEGLCKEE